MGKKKDCGCGKGSKNCISKQSLVTWVEKEMKKLDCGCGCEGKKGFGKKYGIVPYKRKLVGGKVLVDCPPGWRNDGLTCVEPCNDDEYDDGLTCRKKCPPGQINDGLTCRVPITSSMNSCPDGSRDVWGTCWGPIRRDCIDDCFKHPAPGCRIYECGRLRGAFGEDWGPRWCTDCNLRCGQTCWDAIGITKQLHERNLRLMGGEVFLQAIRGKQIRGRVDFNELLKSAEAGLKDLFSGDGPLARAFDPEKNGVAAAMRKFGSDLEGALKEIGDNIKKGFEKMGEDARRAFEQFAKDAESKFKQFGEDFVNKMKDPDFWVEAIGIMAQIAAVALSIAVTVGTLGAGAPLTVGLMAAAAMAGPAAKMIADAARGRPIDALDIAQLLLSGAAAAVPGMSATVGAMVKVGAQAASFAIEAVRVGQALDLIPSTCISGCPPPPPPRGPIVEEEMPPPPPIPPLDPLPTNQLTDEQIEKLGKDINPELFNAKLKNPRRDNPDYISKGNWIALFRHTYYGVPYTGPQNRLISEVDFDGENFNTGVPDETKLPTTEDLEERIPPPPPEPSPPTETPGTDEPNFDDFDFDTEPPTGPTFEFDEETPAGETPGTEEPNFDDFDFDTEPPAGPTFEFDEETPAGETPPPTEGETPGTDEPNFDEFDFDTEPPTGPTFNFDDETPVGGTRPEDMPLIEPMKEGDVTINPWGVLRSSLPTRDIPVTHLGNPFNPECYGRNNPEVASSSGNDAAKLTAHWIDIGSNEGLNGDCIADDLPKEKRLEMMLKYMDEKEKAEAERLLAIENEKLLKIKKEQELEAKKTNCAATDKFWITLEERCDGTRHADGRENLYLAKCNREGSLYETKPNLKPYCNKYRGLNSNLKEPSDKCRMLNNFWDGNRCDETKNVDGTTKTDEDYCTGLNNYYKDGVCDVTKDRDGQPRSEEQLCSEMNSRTEADVFKYIEKYPVQAKELYARLYDGKDVSVLKPVNLKNHTAFIKEVQDIVSKENLTDVNMCNKRFYPDGTLKGRQEMCQSVNNGVLIDNRWCREIEGEYPGTYDEMKEFLRTKKLKIITMNREIRTRDNKDFIDMLGIKNP